MKRAISILLVLLIALSLVPASFAASAVPAPVINAVKSVVRIGADYPDGTMTGSGFVIKNDGYETLIATNHHVVDGTPYEIYIWYNDAIIDAQILADSAERDIAILRLDKCINAEALSIDSDAQLGEAVYGIGFPGAADALSDYMAISSDDATLTDGIISAIRKLTIELGGRTVHLIQTNADINSGNSGGPLLNEDGEVLGINTYAVLDSAGINGAISSEELVSLAEENGISINQAGNISQFFEETPEQSETHSRYEEWLKNHPANKRGDTEEDNEQPGSHSRYEEWLKNHPTNVISAAIESIKSGDLGGINEIKTLTDNGYALTEADKTKIYEAIYNTGIKLYRADNTEKAKQFFETVDPYMDSARYLVLIDFISDEFTIESIERAQSDLKLFPDDLNFENLKEIVVSNFIFATKFLNGRWKDENGKKSLEIICDDVLKDQRAEGTNPLRVRYLGEIPIDGTHNYRSKWETFSDAFHSEILFDNADIYIEIVRINPNAWPKTITSMDFEMFQRMTDKEFKEYYSDYDEENMKVYHIEVVDKNTIVLTRYSDGVELTLYRQ